jgi:uncharacterized protein (DUF111 family)
MKALKPLTRLAEVEARLHGCSLEKVHFHEIAGPDTLVDFLGAALAWDMLGIEAAYCSPFPLGEGEIETRHGRMPLPAPAALELMRGFPTIPGSVTGEACTPTGVALATSWCSPGPWPEGTVLQSVGYGAGQRVLENGRANMLRLWLGSSPQVERQNKASTDSVWQVECNLDNMTAEHLAFAAEQLFAAGCLDVWQESIVMKKNRLGVKLSALVEDEKLGKVLATFSRETLTGGLRWFPVQRLIGIKKVGIAETSAGSVAWKENRFESLGIRRGLPEHESVRAASLRTQIPYREIYREAAEVAKNQVEIQVENPESVRKELK